MRSSTISKGSIDLLICFVSRRARLNAVIDKQPLDQGAEIVDFQIAGVGSCDLKRACPLVGLAGEKVESHAHPDQRYLLLTRWNAFQSRIDVVVKHVARRILEFNKN